MSCVQLSEGGFPGGLPPWLVVSVIRSCSSPIWIWLVNYLHLHIWSGMRQAPDVPRLFTGQQANVTSLVIIRQNVKQALVSNQGMHL